MRLIYLDIKSMNVSKASMGGDFPYIKLINKRELLDFRVEENYTISKTLSIGRQDKNGIVIKDPFISSIHAQIELRDKKSFLRDLGSKNGTFLNGNRIDNGEVLLNDGDKILIGQVEFLFVNAKSSEEVRS
jgi:pSer/pThr/pTyr-binding forkhead associated (FHA) protein